VTLLHNKIPDIERAVTTPTKMDKAFTSMRVNQIVLDKKRKEHLDDFWEVRGTVNL
jgi:hypothetical protein